MTAVAQPISPLLAEVRAGLSRTPKELSPKLFYDRRGSQLFDEITRLPEYYLTRAERALLATRLPSRIARLRPLALVELGAGSADKTRILLTAMADARPAVTYVPIDVSAEFLHDAARRLRTELPRVSVQPVVGDIERPLMLPRALPRPALFAFLGSTIGNFDLPDAVALLRRVRDVMHPGDRLLLGADLRKDARTLEAAYNDAAGVTAEFNRNALRVLNRELGARFDPASFAHRAFYDAVHHRIEMHLVARRAHVVPIPGIGRVAFETGETIRTEISCKYDRGSLAALFAAAGLATDEWIAADDGAYALILGSRCP